MSSSPYERPPLSAVPPTTQQRMGALLLARLRARQILDWLLALPRAAAGWVLRQARRLFGPLIPAALTGRLGWLTGLFHRLAGLTAAVGALPATLLGLTSPLVHRAVGTVLRVVGRVLRAAGRLTGRTLERIAGLLGGRAQQAAAAVHRWLTAALTRLREWARPLAVRAGAAAGLLAALAAALRPIVHAVVSHRLLAVAVTNPWLRVVVEVLILPVLVDHRLLGRLRGWLRRVLTRLAGGAMPSTGVPPVVFTAPPATDADPTPRPRNRAQRRAAQRNARLSLPLAPADLPSA